MCRWIRPVKLPAWRGTLITRKNSGRTRTFKHKPSTPGHLVRRIEMGKRPIWWTAQFIPCWVLRSNLFVRKAHGWWSRDKFYLSEARGEQFLSSRRFYTQFGAGGPRYSTAKRGGHFSIIIMGGKYAVTEKMTLEHSCPVQNSRMPTLMSGSPVIRRKQ